MKHTSGTAYLVGLTLLTLPGIAHAYIDPGTGSMLVQIVIASVVGGLFAVKQFWHRLASICTGKLNKSGRS